MSNDVNVKVSVTANMDKAKSDAGALHKDLKGAADAATAAGRAMSSLQGPKPANQTKAYATASQRATTSRENTDYGVARSVSTGTGAQGRDFAKQAQGLGGLVHVYATFAANLFAVGAAFSALKSAADTTNMIKGLDQLGAASGRNLGGLSKEVVRLTDGAVSLRDAMEAVGKASSSGMSDANIKRLATGASQASKVLGVGMSDALSRLSRGIAKIEPELLDEIGIFVRVDKAAQDYARSLGKPVSALTDFEKRAGFANAVLDQMDQKFGKIKMDANPYDKLLAGLKDVAQTGLETINKVLGPIVSLLASSPTGLTMAIAGVGAVLMKQALPALGNFKDSLKLEADKAAQAANSRYMEVKKILDKEAGDKKARYDKDAEDASAAYERTTKDLKARIESSKKTASKGSDFGKSIAGKDLPDITNEELAKLDKLGEKNTKISATYRQLATDVRNYRIEEEKYKVVAAQIESDKAKALSSGTPKNLAIINSREQTAAYTREMQSQAAYTASTLGVSRAWKELGENIAKARAGQATRVVGIDASGKDIVEKIPAIGMLSAATQKAKGAFNILGGAISTAMNAFAPWLQAIGLAVAGFGLLNNWMTKTGEETVATTAAIEGLDSSIKNVVRTLEFINESDPLYSISVEAIQARATAFSTLGSSIKDALTKSFAELDKMGNYDKSINWVKDFFNSSVEDNIAESMSKAISKGFEAAPDTPGAKESAKKIAELLGVGNVKDTKAMDASIEKLAKSGDAGRAVLKEVSKEFSNISNEAAIAAAKGTEFKASLGELNKQFKTFSNSFIPSDNFSKLGQTVIESSIKMSRALEDPSQSLAAMNDLVKNQEALALFPPSMAQGLQARTKDIEDISKEMSISIARTKDLQIVLDDLDKQKSKQQSQRSLVSGKELNPEILRLDNVRKDVSNLQGLEVGIKLELQDKIDEHSKIFAQAAKAQFVFGAEIISSRLSVEWAKVGTAMGGVFASVMGNTKEGIELKANLDKQVLSAQVESLKVQQNLILAQYKTIEETKLLRLVLEKETALKDSDFTKASEANKEIEKVKEGQKYSSGKRGDTSAAAKALANNEINKETLDLAIQLESSTVKIKELYDQIGAVSLRAIVDQIAAANELESRSLKAEADRISFKKQLISLVKIPTELMSMELVQGQVQLDQEALKNKHLTESLDIRTKVQQLELLISKASGDIKIKLEQNLETYKKTTVANTEARQEQEKVLQSIDSTIKLKEQEYQIYKKITEEKVKAAQHSIDVSKETISGDSARLARLKESGLLSSENAAKEESRIKKESLDLERKQIIFTLDAAKDIKQQEYNLLQDQYALIARKFEYLAAEAAANKLKLEQEDPIKNAKKISELGKTVEGNTDKASDINKLSNSINQQAELALANMNAQKVRALELLSIKKKNLELETKYTEQLAKSADNTLKMQQFANNIKGLFGDKITGIDEFVTAMSEVLTQQNKYTVQLDEISQTNARLEKQNRELSTSATNMFATENIAKAIKDSAKLADNKKIIANNTELAGKVTEKQQENEAQGTMKVLSASKKMFKEKTAAFKIISALEKAQQIYNLVMMGKEIIMMGQKTIAAVTSSTTIAAAKTGETVAGAASSIASAGSGDPYTGIARVVAMIALMGVALAMVGKSGTSKSPSSFVMNSEQRQQTQGTGQTYDATGSLVDTGGGVYGDSSAKSASIVNSLEIMKNNSVEGLRYQNRMVAALDKMVSALTGAAEAIYNIPGLRKGANIGGAVLGKTTTTKDYLNDIGFMNGLATVNKIMLGGLGDTFTKSILNSPIGKILGPIVNSIGNMVFGGKTTVDTSIVSTGIDIVGSLTDLAKGTTADLLKTFNDIKVSTKTKGGWFGKNKESTSYSRQYGTLAPEAKQLLTDVFANAVQLFKGYGAELGVAEEEVSAKLSSINLSQSIDFTGLNGTQIQEELNSVISTMMDETATSLFKYLEVYRNFGEGMSETLARVVRTNAIAEQSLKNSGIIDIRETLGKTGVGVSVTKYDSIQKTRQVTSSTPTEKTKVTEFGADEFGNLSYYYQQVMEDIVTTVSETYTELVPRLTTEISRSDNDIAKASIAITENLVELAGGIDTFLERVIFYRENFLTKKEQLAPTVEEVTGIMKNLVTDQVKDESGLLKDVFTDFSTVDTRAEFKALVSSLDLTTKAGQITYNSLMDIAPGFHEVVSAVEEIQSKSKLAATDFAVLFKDTLTGALKPEDLSAKTNKLINDGLINVIADAQISLVTTAISEQLIEPFITAIVTGTSLSTAISETAIASVTATATAAAAAMTALFNDPTFVSTIQLLGTTITGVIQTTMSGISKIGADTVDEIANIKMRDALIAKYSTTIQKKAEDKALVTAAGQSVPKTPEGFDNLYTTIYDLAKNARTDTLEGQNLLKNLEAAAPALERFESALDTTINALKKYTTTEYNRSNLLNKIKGEAAQYGVNFDDTVMSNVSRASSDDLTTYIRTIDTTTEAGVNMLNLMGKIAPLMEELNSNLNTQIATRKTLNVELLKAAGLENEAIALQRLLDIQGFTDAEVAIYDFNQSIRDTITILGERKTLQDEFDSLTMDSTDLLNKQRVAVDGSNLALFDQVQAVKTAKAAIESLTAEIENIKDVRLGVEDSKQSVISNMKGFDAVAYYTSQKTINKAQFSASTTTADKVKYAGKWQNSINDLLNAEISALDKTKETRLKGLEDTNDAWQKAADTSKEAAENMVSAMESIEEFLRTLRTGSLSTLSPEEKLREAGAEYNRILTLTKGGDAEAAQKLVGSSETYLNMARDYYASTSGYTSIFNSVESSLSDVASQKSVYQQIADTALNNYNLDQRKLDLDAEFEAETLKLQQKAVDSYVELDTALAAYQVTLEAKLTIQNELLTKIIDDNKEAAKVQDANQKSIITSTNAVAAITGGVRQEVAAAAVNTYNSNERNAVVLRQLAEAMASASTLAGAK